VDSLPALFKAQLSEIKSSLESFQALDKDNGLLRETNASLSAKAEQIEAALTKARQHNDQLQRDAKGLNHRFASPSLVAYSRNSAHLVETELENSKQKRFERWIN